MSSDEALNKLGEGILVLDSFIPSSSGWDYFDEENLNVSLLLVPNEMPSVWGNPKENLVALFSVLSTQNFISFLLSLNVEKLFLDALQETHAL